MLKKFARHAWHRIEQVAASRGYAIKWYSKPLINEEYRIPSDIEFSLPHLLICKKSPFFVCLGANDGRHNDPIYPFIKYNNIPGILLEPISEVFERLQSLHKGNPKVQCINAALSESDGERTIYTVDVTDGVFSRAHQFSSFRRESLLSQTSWVPDVADRIIERKVPTISFNTLKHIAAEAGASSIDILQTDTEGFDGEIIRLMWSSSIEPDLVNFEHLHMTKSEIQDHISRFISKGYLVSIGDADVLAYRPPYRFDYRKPDLAPPELRGWSRAHPA